LARASLRYGSIALIIVLFRILIRRTGERVGRLSERLEFAERNMPSSTGCWGRRLTDLSITTRWLTGRASVGFEQRGAVGLSGGRGVQQEVSGTASGGIGAAAGKFVRP
jgi:hypothetical protein